MTELEGFKPYYEGGNCHPVMVILLPLWRTFNNVLGLGLNK